MSPEFATLTRMQEISPAPMFMLRLPQADVPPPVATAVVRLVDDPKEYHLRGGTLAGRACRLTSMRPKRQALTHTPTRARWRKRFTATRQVQA